MWKSDETARWIEQLVGRESGECLVDSVAQRNYEGFGNQGQLGRQDVVDVAAQDPAVREKPRRLAAVARRPHVGNLDRVLVRELADRGLERQNALRGGALRARWQSHPRYASHPAITAV